jgi:glycosyl transferase family 87
LTVNAFRQAAMSSRKPIMKAGLFAVAIISLSYAVLTAPKSGIDLVFFYNGAREWVDGVFQIGSGPIGEYPPFALPLFSPIAFVPFDKLLLVWLALKIAATAFCLLLVIKLWGSDWPIRTRVYLSAFLLTWAPFRVTLRNGQISLMIMALLLGALLARRRKREFLAGALLGLSLCKYSLTFPYFLYFVWRREWKIVSTAILIPLALTEVFALRLGLSLFEVIGQYTQAVSHIYLSGVSPDMGTTEIKLLILELSGGRETFAAIITLALSIAALICMGVVFSRKPRWEPAHFSALALFSLWSVYHRTYDAVLCLLPAVLLVDLLVRKKFVAFSRFWLAGLGLLIISIPGVLVDRLKLSAADFAGNPLLLLGLHIERLLVFGMFWSLLFLMWKSKDMDRPAASESIPKTEEKGAPVTLVPESPHCQASG